MQRALSAMSFDEIKHLIREGTEFSEHNGSVANDAGTYCTMSPRADCTLQTPREPHTPRTPKHQACCYTGRSACTPLPAYAGADEGDSGGFLEPDEIGEEPIEKCDVGYLDSQILFDPLDCDQGGEAGPISHATVDLLGGSPLVMSHVSPSPLNSHVSQWTMTTDQPPPQCYHTKPVDLMGVMHLEMASDYREPMGFHEVGTLDNLSNGSFPDDYWQDFKVSL